MKLLRIAILTITALLVMVMAVATFIEYANGHDVAAVTIYHAPWFIALWGTLAAMGIAAIIKWKLWRRFWVFMIHISLLLILLGALVSHLTARQGTLHLRQGDTADYFFPSDKDQAAPLPFALRLDTFTVAYHTGTGAPRDFQSHVTVMPNRKAQATGEKEVIRMNHILSRNGYRFYQTSYDPDQKGTILTVSHDPIGLPLTYAAYALLGLAMMIVLAERLFKKGTSNPFIMNGIGKGKTLLLIPLFFAALPLTAKESVPTVNAEQAAKMERLQVSGEDRVMPLGTLARDFLLSVYGKTSYRGLTGMQVLAGWTLRPDAWKDQPMILIKDKELRRRLGVKEGKHASFASLFDKNGNYLVAPLTADSVPAPLRKAAEKLDEEVGLILLATRGELVRPAPTNAKVSEQKVSAELFYNRLPHALPLFITCLLLSIAILITDKRREASKHERKADIVARHTCHVLLYLVTFYHTALYILRWYIGGRIPMGNGPETMLFMSLCLLWLATASRRFQPVLTAPAVMMAGFTLLVAHISESQPRIGGLMPVLQSPLLTIHVSVIMSAYALLALTCILSLMALFSKDTTLTVLSHRILLPAVFLLAGGIFLGAIWAGVSWGTYWSWDPKEVWALITMLAYALPLHIQSLPFFKKPRTYNIYIVCAFFTVLFTYFGVNFFLGGMHSYA